MADTGDDLLDGDGLLADTGDFDEDLDGDAEDALLADDTSYSDPYNLRTVPNSGRDVYIKSDHSTSNNQVSARSSVPDTIYHEVEDVVEGDEIIDEDEEDVLDLGVTDEFENELQDHPHNSSSAPVWIKQERVDKDNVSSLVAGNRLQKVHRVDNHSIGPTIKQEPHDVADTTEVNVPNKQHIVTSSTEVLNQKYQRRVNESDEDENNDDEQRDRFKTERTNVISLKNNNTNKWGEIPDSLDSIVTQQFNQHQKGGLTTRGGTARRGRPQPSLQQHPSSHKIHINPHFKKTADLQHSQQIVHPSPWEDQVPVQQQQPQYDAPLMHHNVPPSQHYGPPQLPPQHIPSHQTHPQPLPHGPPQMYHQQPVPHESIHTQPPHLPQPQPPPAPWIRNEGMPPPAQSHFDPQYSGGHHMQQQHQRPSHQQYYQPPGPPPNSAIYPQQHPPYDQNTVQHHHPPPMPPHLHQNQPGYEYQQVPPQRLVQPPPPGDEENVVQCSPVRTVQFSRDSQQITIQMAGNSEMPPSHYNPNQPFNHNIRPPHPQHQNNNWINREAVPPVQTPQQQHRPPHFIQHSPQQPPPRMQVLGQHPRFMRGGIFRRGINRHPHLRHPHPQHNKPAFTGGPAGDGPFVISPGGGIGKRLGEVLQPPGVPFKQARFNNPNNVNVQQPIQQQLQHQRKGPVMSNLCEIPTVDNVPDTTTKIEQSLEDEDEETRQYRLKIVEQKQLREKLLQQKEMRRQMAAVKKQQEIQQKLLTDQPAQQINNEIPMTTVVGPQQQLNQNQHQAIQRLSVHQRIGGKVLTPVQVNNPVQNSSIAGYKIVRVRAKDGSILIKKMPVKGDGQFVAQQRLRQQGQNFPQQQNLQQQQYHHIEQGGSYIVPTINRRIVVDNMAAHKQTLAKGCFHAARKRAMKKNMTPVTTIVPTKPATQAMTLDLPHDARKRPIKKNMSPVTTIVPTKPAAQAMTLGQRFSMQASQQQQPMKIENKSSIHNQQSQQQQLAGKSNRKVISSSGPGGAYNGSIKVTASPPGPISHTVVVDNLTASTSKEQLVKMARQVGEVEKMNLEPQLKRATITFKNTNSAGAFYLKFQRKMVDLSMINVSIVPE